MTTTSTLGPTATSSSSGFKQRLANRRSSTRCDGWSLLIPLVERVQAVHDDDMRDAQRQHWAASDANDFDAEHSIYRDDAVLEYPQSGERIRGRHNIQASREAQPNMKRFTVRRVLGGGDLWISELVLTYDAEPFYVVSIMEFEDGKSPARRSTLAKHSNLARPVHSGSNTEPLARGITAADGDVVEFRHGKTSGGKAAGRSRCCRYG